ncbi:MAG: ABC transporter permease [Actinomycetota bacterium]|nr:ABC transporter permease [Actinomycetota bacterium]
MATLGDVLRWFSDAAHWRGPAGVPNRLLEHASLSGRALLVALVVALPVGLVLGHTGKGGAFAVNVSNVGRAVPSLALLVLAVEVFGLGDTPPLVALVALAVPPVLTNTYVGMRGVDRDVREAAVGMGMSGGQVLARVEAPLALPLVLAGVRTAAVQVVATATLAALVAAGGLGRYIVDGIAQQDEVQLMAGGILVAVLAVSTEVALGWLQARATPGRRGGPPVAGQVPHLRGDTGVPGALRGA